MMMQKCFQHRRANVVARVAANHQLINGKPMIKCYIGLGSNLANPVAQIRAAIEALQQIPATQLTRLSSFYWSTAVGPSGQDDYLNGAAELLTAHSAETLLDFLQAIETAQGRKRIQHWGARTLDLDILLYGDHTINTERLQIPHRELLQRDFVIRPLLDIDETICLPDSTKLASRLDYCPNNHLRPSAEIFKHN
jgi:2-amino-4-hydroxy-6-hydroxymethyldihydropteridine diphosphokinase